jgi:hypothetical protein
VKTIKNITLRVDDDFHYSVKTYSAKKGMTLQKYMIEVVTEDLKKNKAYVKSPITDLVDKLTDDEIAEVLEKINERRKREKK